MSPWPIQVPCPGVGAGSWLARQGQPGSGWGSVDSGLFLCGSKGAGTLEPARLWGVRGC